MTQSKKIAVTGGVGSGKSAVLKLLKEKYPVFSCDEIDRQLCREEWFLRAIGEQFPGCVREGKLDRGALSRLVFSDPNARGRLNAVTHPAIMERLISQMEKYPLSFAEVPLLFEGKFEGLFDDVIAVLRPLDARMEAIAKRDGLTDGEIAARMAAQRDWESPPAGCRLLYNRGSLADLEKSLEEILAEMGVAPA